MRQNRIPAEVMVDLLMGVGLGLSEISAFSMATSRVNAPTGQGQTLVAFLL
jgi:hypothetical protein